MYMDGLTWGQGRVAPPINLQDSIEIRIESEKKKKKKPKAGGGGKGGG